MNLLKLAELELIRENKKVSDKNLVEYMVKIREWLDIHREITAQKILAGGKVNKYGNRIIIT
jgi:hypothetical protein